MAKKNGNEVEQLQKENEKLKKRLAELDYIVLVPQR